MDLLFEVCVYLLWAVAIIGILGILVMMVIALLAVIKEFRDA